MIPVVYASLGAFIVGAAAGYQVMDWRCEAADAERAAAQQRDTLRRMDKADAAAVEHEQAKVKIQERIRYVTREVDRIVERPIYRDGPACIDADGLRLVAEAVGAAGSASQPAPAVPAASAAR